MKEKIGIISDTHGLLRPEVLEILKDCKYILHAGDVNKDEILDVLRSMGNLYVVRGNNDKDWAEKSPHQSKLYHWRREIFYGP